MDFLKDAWPWWVAGGLVAVVMHFAVKRAKLNLRPEQLVALENQATTKAHRLISIFLKFAAVWVVLVVAATSLLVLFLKK